MKLNYKCVVMGKQLSMVSLLLLLFAKCDSEKLNTNKFDCKDFSKMTIYPSNTDSSNYIIIKFYCSGDTFEKIVYKNESLYSYESWFISGRKEKEECNYTSTKEIPYHGRDTAIGIVGYLENICTSKHWNEQGVLIYETNLLPNKREQRITRDSVGNIVKIDTISY